MLEWYAFSDQNAYLEGIKTKNKNIFFCIQKRVV